MSLGFRSESALLPSKSKKITVDSSSLIDLKAVVYKKEQNLKRHGIESQGLRKKRGRQDLALKKGRGEEIANPGIEARQAKDEAEHQREKGKARRAKDILARKAAVYEKMASGKLNDEDGTFLVNFDKKSVLHQKVTSNNEVERDKDQENTCSENLVELPRQFGKQFKESNRDLDERVGEVHAEQSRGTWAWSKGEGRSDAAEWQKPTREGYDFDPVESSDLPEQHSVGNARVLSQWERTLNAKSKKHLEEIHQETNKNRTAAEERLREKQHRREMLRKKQQQRFEITKLQKEFG